MTLTLRKACEKPHRGECFWVTIKGAKAFRRETAVEKNPQMCASGLKEINCERETKEG